MEDQRVDAAATCGGWGLCRGFARDAELSPQDQACEVYGRRARDFARAGGASHLVATAVASLTNFGVECDFALTVRRFVL